MPAQATKSDEKREAVFTAAPDVFARYGFRRTSMNDIAQAAGISRPALYVLFENKEDLFRQLATNKQKEAMDEAMALLSQDAPLTERFTAAILVYERILYEPLAGSPHGAEFLDLHRSIASDELRRGHDQLITNLAQAVADASSAGDVSLEGAGMKPKPYVELLMSSVTGQKTAATSVKDFRQRVKHVTSIFLASITSGGV